MHGCFVVCVRSCSNPNHLVRVKRTNLRSAFLTLCLLVSGCSGRTVERTTPQFVWEGLEGDRCLSLRIYDGGRAAFGQCDAPHLPVTLLEPRAEEWSAIRDRFAAFANSYPKIVFNGAGHEVASPAWVRAISEWGRLTQLETAAGRSGASIGTAYVWQISAEGDFCDYLTVELYGRAFAHRARCEGGNGVNLGGGWLTAEEMAEFDRWYYAFSASETTRQGAKLHFFGRGTQALDEAEVAQLARWSEAVFDRLRVD